MGAGIVVGVTMLRHRFSVDDYYRMGEAGVLGEDDRVELLEGEVVTMSPIGSRHAFCVDQLTRLLGDGLRGRAVLRVHNPVRLNQWSEPQPDVSLLRPPHRRYAAAHPVPGDVFLVIEVADSSVISDRSFKLPLYARAGIPEAWLVDLVANRVELYREPSATGYGYIERVEREGTVRPSAFDDLALAVADLIA